MSLFDAIITVRVGKFRPLRRPETPMSHPSRRLARSTRSRARLRFSARKNGVVYVSVVVPLPGRPYRERTLESLGPDPSPETIRRVVREHHIRIKESQNVD